MPELPEVETIKRGLSPLIISQTLEKITIRQSKLRWPIESYLSKITAQQTIRHIDRRGKYLLFQFDHGTLIIHLGMSGSLVFHTKYSLPAKHDHVDFVFNGGNILRYNDPRRFGAILWTDAPLNEHKLFSKLGPEPLSRKFNAKYLHQRAERKTIAIKKFIMDSHVVVGVGNIYANEALFSAGIHPLTAANKVSFEKISALVKTIKATLRSAIKSGGTTLKDFKNSTGKPGYFKQKLLVYGRANQACMSCSNQLEEIRIDSRSTVFCPHCQV